MVNIMLPNIKKRIQSNVYRQRGELDFLEGSCVLKKYCDELFLVVSFATPRGTFDVIGHRRGVGVRYRGSGLLSLWLR